MTRLTTAFFAVMAVMVAMAFAMPAQALTWVCSTSEQHRIAIAAAQRAKAELGDGTVAGAAVGLSTRGQRHRTRIDRLDLIQAYSGQPVLFGGTWLLVVMLPQDHPITRQAFADLGLSAHAAHRMATGSGLIDRGIRVVQTPEQMINKVAINPPAAGYVGFFSGARDVAICF